MDLSLVPTSGIRLTVTTAEGDQWARGRVRIEQADGVLTAWRRRDVLATGTPVEVTRTNARIVEIVMADGSKWLTSGCGCGGG